MGKGMGIGMEARYKPKTKESGFVSPLLLVPGGGGGGSRGVVLGGHWEKTVKKPSVDSIKTSFSVL